MNTFTLKHFYDFLNGKISFLQDIRNAWWEECYTGMDFISGRNKISNTFNNFSFLFDKSWNLYQVTLISVLVRIDILEAWPGTCGSQILLGGL